MATGVGSRAASCSLGLSATSQQYFSLRTNQPPATSQQYLSLRTSHQPNEQAAEWRRGWEQREMGRVREGCWASWTLAWVDDKVRRLLTVGRFFSVDERFMGSWRPDLEAFLEFFIFNFLRFTKINAPNKI
jgi:hypothetical protein